MAIVAFDWMTILFLALIIGAWSFNSASPWFAVIGYGIQFCFGIGLIYIGKHVGEVKHLVNSRSDNQDRVIADLRRDLDEMRDAKHKQSETLAYERGAGVATQAAIATAAAAEPPKESA
jgi:hypothetical protein